MLARKSSTLPGRSRGANSMLIPMEANAGGDRGITQDGSPIQGENPYSHRVFLHATIGGDPQ